MKKKNIDCRGMLLVFLAAAILIFAHCSPAAAAEAIVLGDERTDEYMPLLDGKRIALFANHSAMVKGEHLLELLLRNGEHVTVLYTLRSMAFPMSVRPFAPVRAPEKYVPCGAAM